MMYGVSMVPNNLTPKPFQRGKGYRSQNTGCRGQPLPKEA